MLIHKQKSKLNRISKGHEAFPNRIWRENFLTRGLKGLIALSEHCGALEPAQEAGAGSSDPVTPSLWHQHVLRAGRAGFGGLCDPVTGRDK